MLEVEAMMAPRMITQGPLNMQIFLSYLSEMMAPTGAVMIEPQQSHPISLSLSLILEHGGVKAAYTL